MRLLGSGLWDDPTSAASRRWSAAGSPPRRRRRGAISSAASGDLRPQPAAPRLARLSMPRRSLRCWRRRQGGEPFSQQAILNPSGFTGVDGLFRFTPDGLVQRGLAVLEVEPQGARRGQPGAAELPGGRLLSALNARRAAEDRVEALAAGGGSGKTVAVEGQKAAFDQRLRAAAEQRPRRPRRRCASSRARETPSVRRRPIISISSTAVSRSIGDRLFEPGPGCLDRGEPCSRAADTGGSRACRRPGSPAHAPRGRSRHSPGSANRRGCAGIRPRAAHGSRFRRRAARGRRAGAASPRRARPRHPPRARRGSPRARYRGKGGAGLDRQLVEREMLAGERQRLVELGVPSRDALARAGIDQVEREPREDVAGMLDRGDRLVAVVPPAQKAQRRRVERLDAEREPVDPGCGKSPEAIGLGGIRVRLQSDFEIGRTCQCVRTRSSNAATVSGGISDGVPPPKNTEPTVASGRERRLAGRDPQAAPASSARRRHCRGHGC